MADITLKQLRYFEAIAAQGHFGRAADICAISQPAISVQIRELERTLGVTLFERATRQIHLTNAGRDLLTRARAILASVDELSDAARASVEQLRPTFCRHAFARCPATTRSLIFMFAKP